MKSEQEREILIEKVRELYVMKMAFNKQQAELSDALERYLQRLEQNSEGGCNE